MDDPRIQKDAANSMSKPSLFPSLLVACGLLLTACSEPKPIEKKPRPVRVETVRYAATTVTAHYSGEVKVHHEPALSFQVAGKLAKRWVDVGTTVQAGQLLATLDPPDYKIDQAGAAAQLQAAQAELNQARNDLQHSANLLAKELTNAAHHERRQDAVRAAEARVAQARAGLDINARKAAYTELRAEQPGVITAVEAEAGQVVAAGQTIFRLARTDEKEVAINVPENRLEDLRAATAIKVSLWAKPGVFYAGKLREISPGVDATIRTFTVKISILGADEAVRIGMTATVDVQHEEPQQTAWIPLTAVSYDGKQAIAWIFNPTTRTVNPRPITLGGYDDENAKILDGLKTGEQIVTAGIHKLLPGEPARLLSEDRP